MDERDRAPDRQELNRQAIAEFALEAEQGPVVMLNLLRFRPDGGPERYADYGAAVGPLLARVGARPIFAGRPGLALIGGAHWDLVVLAEYPTRQAFLDMVSSTDYLEIEHLRAESLLDSELHPIEPIELPDV